MSPSKLLAVKSNVLMPSPEKLDLYAIKQRRQVQQIAIERSSNKSSVRAEMEQTQKEFSDGRYCAPEGQSPQKNTMATFVEIGSDGDRQVHIVKLKTDNSKSANYLKLSLSN